MLRNFIKKFIALLSMICFVYSSVLSQGLNAMIETKREVNKIEKAFDEFVIPSSAGRITESKYFGSSKVVINIQDLHCHSEVQRNISKILSFLDEKYELPKVYIEGGIDEVDTSWLKSIIDKKIRQKIIDSFIDSGKLTGAEYFAISSDKSKALIGLEDEKLYIDNISRLSNIIDKRKEIQAVMPDIEKKLELLKSTYYSPLNKKLEKLINRHSNNRISSDKYYKLLLRLAERSKIDINVCRNINEFAGIIGIQGELNYKKISRQLNEFILSLKSKLPYNAYKMLLDKTKNLSKPDELYIYLMQITKEYDLKLGNEYNELNKFFDFLCANQKINPIDLIKEEKNLIRELHQRFSESGAEKEIAFISDFFEYLKQYFENKISAQDYEYFKKNKEEFSLLWARYISTERIPQLKPYYELFETFYKANIDRNYSFIKNTLGDIKNIKTPDIRLIPDIDHNKKTLESLKDAKEIFVLVTGGFHTSGITELLKDRKISYLVITPNVTQDTKIAESAYTELAKHQGKILSETIALFTGLESLRYAKTLDKLTEDLAKPVGNAVEVMLKEGYSKDKIKNIINESVLKSAKNECAKNLRLKNSLISDVKFELNSQEKDEFSFSIITYDKNKNKKTFYYTLKNGQVIDEGSIKDKKAILESLKIENYGIQIFKELMEKGTWKDFEPILMTISEQFNKDDIKQLTKEREGYALLEIAKVRPDLFTREYINSIAYVDEYEMQWNPRREIPFKGFFKLIEILEKKNPDAVKIEIKKKEIIKTRVKDHFRSVREGILANHERGIEDEFVEPFAVVDENDKPVGLVEDGDQIIFTNFRSDRAKQISLSFINPEFNEFNVKNMPNIGFVGFTLYDKDFNKYPKFKYAFSFKTENILNSLGEYISKLGEEQLRGAETEKETHATKFLTGGTSSEPLKGEKRIIIKSKDKDGSYSNNPEMSSYPLTDQTVS